MDLARSERPFSAPHRRELVIVLAAVLTLSLYVLLPHIARGLTLAEPSFAGRVLPWAGIESRETLAELQKSKSHAGTSAAFLTICAALFGAYFFVLRCVRGLQTAGIQRLLLGAGAAFLVVQLFGPVMLSTDVFAYAIYGRVFSVYGGNPYDAAPFIAPSDPYMPLFGQEYLPSWYGPLWTVLSALVAWCGGTNVALTVLLFRALAILSALICAVLILAIMRKTAPERAAQGLVFFIWNPLLVIETGMSGHNDCVMLSLVLLGIWLHVRDLKMLAVVSLALSSLVKFLTGMLVPLYLVLLMRESKSWRERFFILARGALVASVVWSGGMLLTRSNSELPAGQAALKSDFYRNNFHELIFRGLRRLLGEDEVSADTSVYFQGWWLASSRESALREMPTPQGHEIRKLAPGTRVVVASPQNDEWARVYVPEARCYGYVDTSDFTESTRPANANMDPLAVKHDRVAAEWTTVQTANRWIRVGTWTAFACFGLFCAWRTKDLTSFLVWSAAALLASYYFIITEIWPWYVNWVIAICALVPDRHPARLTLLLSPAMMTLYVTLGYLGGEPRWIADYRSLFAFVLPLVIFLSLPRVSRTEAGKEIAAV